MEDATLYAQLGAALAARRKSKGLTQAKLAALTGISRAALANIELGRQQVLVHYLYRFADVLGAKSVDELLPRVRKKGLVNHDLQISESAQLTAKQKLLVASFVSSSAPKTARRRKD